jgi:hypothetical protein
MMGAQGKQRCLIRLSGYDYSQTGAYFVTICGYNRECLFGDAGEGVMVMNEYGKITDECWREIPRHFSNAELDEYVVMPNHLHGIIVIVDTPQGTGCGIPLGHGMPCPNNTNDSDVPFPGPFRQ